MKLSLVLCFLILPHLVFGIENFAIFAKDDKVERRYCLLADLIIYNLKHNGWSNIIYAGRDFPDYFYVKIQRLSLSFTVTHPDTNDAGLANIVPHYSNTVILHCKDLDEFEGALLKAMASPYWHPHANTVLYYHSKGQEDIPTIFIIYWFYSICNGIVVQYDDIEENLLVAVYNPYVNENYKLSYQYGCWKTTKIGKPVKTFKKSFTCEYGCHNVTIHSKLRDSFLGTCIGYDIISIRYGDTETLKTVNFFEDKGKNLHGFVGKALGTEALPFLMVRELANGTYSFESRDGMIWNTAAQLMNFTMNLDAVKDILKKPFDFVVNVKMISSFLKRQADLFLFPVYQFEFVFVDMDRSVAYKDSGVCIVSHRAGFETVLFDSNLLADNIGLVIEFSLCFMAIWLTFLIFSTFETGKLSLNQAGKDFVNTIRNILSISLYKPPKTSTFRIYLFVSIWSFFIFNFATQAAITSFFSAYKKGKEVETFEDILEKGYKLEGAATPDMFLPDDEKRFVKFNSRIVNIPTMFGCVEQMVNDSQRFCLLDCAVARYLERNKLNKKGQQYLHVVKDRVHSYYLNFMLHKHSPLTQTFNRLLRKCFEAGLIKKWEQYRFSDMKNEVYIQALKLEDLIGIFKCFYFALGIASLILVTEIFIYYMKRIYRNIVEKIARWKKALASHEKNKGDRKLGKVKVVDTFTQTA